MTPTVGGDVGAARRTRGRGPRSDRTLLKWPVQLHGEPTTDDRTLTDIIWVWVKDQDDQFHVGKIT